MRRGNFKIRFWLGLAVAVLGLFALGGTRAEAAVACTALSCSFDASGSGDRDGTIGGYSWEFGDGASGSGKTVAGVTF
jgi:PKD domain